MFAGKTRGQCEAKSAIRAVKTTGRMVSISESGFDQNSRESQPDIGLATGSAPVRNDPRDIDVELSRRRRKVPGTIVVVFVKDSFAPRFQSPCHTANDFDGIGTKARTQRHQTRSTAACGQPYSRRSVSTVSMLVRSCAAATARRASRKRRERSTATTRPPLPRFCKIERRVAGSSTAIHHGHPSVRPAARQRSRTAAARHDAGHRDGGSQRHGCR